MTDKPARLSDEHLRVLEEGIVLPKINDGLVSVTLPRADVRALLAEVRAGRELRRKLRMWAENTRHAGEIAADPDACDVADASPQYRSGKAVAYLYDAEEIEAMLADEEADHE